MVVPNFLYYRIRSGSGIPSRHLIWSRFLTTPTTTTLPKHAEVVICGSGIVGNSVAYHLTQRGIQDIVLIQLPQNYNKFTGSLNDKIRAPLVRLRSNQQEQVILKSFSTYKTLQDQGFDIGLVVNGGLYLAQNRESMTTFKRRKDTLSHTGKLHIELLSPNEIRERFPIITTEDLEGGALVHDDAIAHPAKIVQALLSLATKAGAKLSDCKFNKVLVKDGRVQGVETDAGIISCNHFVNSADWYAWEYGQRQTPPVRIPSHAVGRHYIRTKPAKVPLPNILPTIIDCQARAVIIKVEDNSLVLGGFEKNAKPVFKDCVPETPTELNFDWDHFAPTLNGAINRLPLIKSCEVATYASQPSSYSADGHWIIGETPEIQNYYVAAATNGNALEVGGGIGEFLAHWIAKRERSAPLLHFDILRFVDIHNCKKFLLHRASEAVGKQIEPCLPYVSYFKKARNIRCSPLNATLNECGAVNGEFMGYEAPLYFDRKTPNPQGNIFPDETHFKPNFLKFVEKEHDAFVNGVGVVDMSSYGKFKVSSAGPQVVSYLQRLCSSNVDIPISHLCATGMLNQYGGYETDCIVIRNSEYSFTILTPATLQTKTPTWMRKFLPPDGSVTLHDITSKYSIIQLIGPKSPSILSKMALRDMRMKPRRTQEVDLSYAPKITVITFTNTLSIGYSLLIPSEYALHVYKELMRVGKDYGIRNAGWYAHRTLRMEQFVSFWGDEINSFVTPVEIDRTVKIDLNKDFMGKEAIQKQLKNGVKKMLVSFMLKPTEAGYSIEHDCWSSGGEPIFRNGIYVGHVTSSMYGFTNNVHLLYVFVTNPNKETSELGIVTKDYIRDKDAIYHIDLAGKRFKIEALQRVKLVKNQKINN